MTRASARRASFASRGPGNTAATSGSSVTVRLPFAYREAYLFRRARLKSYSGRTSSARRRRAARVLAFAFLMNSPLAARRLARADQPDHIVAFREHYHEQPAPRRLPEQYEPLFARRVAWVFRQCTVGADVAGPHHSRRRLRALSAVTDDERRKITRDN